ncbi:30S ribosomal protein S21 [Fastidiosibacter lacustris]|uniref:30S ribosomal protein S21 n=1 Tax=Fastidiosibacter lacustris TaxID=2056695 RepID=UPI000E345A85|nr:30S ribosomal protein S21 [Fastidiosibacter lacustris]
MPKIRVDDRRPFEVNLRQFKRACEKAGIIKELRERKHYIKPTEQRKIAKRVAISRTKKAAKMALRPRFS